MEIISGRTVRTKDGGSALSLVALAVVVLAMAGVGLLTLGLKGRLLAIRTVQQIEARCAADAALAKAIFVMNQQLKAKTWGEKWAPRAIEESTLPYAMNERLPNCDATFSYKITSTSIGGREFLITCTGTSGPATKIVYATTKLKSLFDSAILVQDRISLMPNTIVAGYNSADPLDTDIDLKIGTTSILADRIPLGPGTVVNGDVFVGVGGNPGTVIGAGGTITGQKYALSEPIEFPVITAPALPAVGTILEAKGATITIGPANSGRYGGITLTQAAGKSGILEIAGGDVALYITGNIDLGTGCEVIIRPNSSLTLYVDGNINASNSGGLNNQSGKVKDFKLYATGTGPQTFDLKAKSNVFGAVYAPKVNITMYPSAEVHGSIVGNSVTFKSGGNFYYDEALRDVTVYEEGVQFDVKRWREE